MTLAIKTIVFIDKYKQKLHKNAHQLKSIASLDQGYKISIVDKKGHLLCQYKNKDLDNLLINILEDLCQT